MDEAERCHRLAFIFGGRVLDVGTPTQVVERRHLRAAEVDVDQPDGAEAALRADSRVAEISHFGGMLRVTTKGETDPMTVVREVFAARGIAPRTLHEARVSVEDAFVEMVREDERGNARRTAAAGGGRS
jgi:ABC-2 type transport system ATP-binding protein